MKISIVGLNKTDVLLALYDNAKFGGTDFASIPMLQALAHKSKKGLRETAEELLKIKTYFDSVDLGGGPRPFGIDLTGFEFDSTEYDRAHGEGEAQSVINVLRNTQSVINGLRCAYTGQIDADPEVGKFARLLSAVVKKIEAEQKPDPVIWQKTLRDNLNSKKVGSNIEQKSSTFKLKSAL